MKREALRSALDEALEKAGAVLKKHAGKARVRYKGRADLVTQADTESEEAVLRVIERRCPGHDLFAEEKARRLRGSDYTWVIDPLDGTTNYAHGYPAYCVSIGLLHKGKPLLAGVYDPNSDERFLAEAGRGARLNGRPIKVTRTRGLEESLLVTGFGYDRAARSHFYIEFYRRFMVQSHDVRRSGSAARDLAWIAAGRADGFWELNLSPWDVAAGLLLVREAGGKVTDFSGKPWAALSSFGRETLATNGLLHTPMLKVIQSCLKTS